MSDDGGITFLRKVSTSIHSSNTEKRKLGSSTPLFRSQQRRGLETAGQPQLNGEPPESNLMTLLENETEANLTALLENKLTLPPAENKNGVVKEEENVRPAIHMDAMAFGMGCCCLQVTFQAKDVDESRFMYDQLAVVAPIFMALTASTPILKGRLADTDCRWGIISESVDDRTPGERGLEDEEDHDVAGKGKRRIYKSRYDCISAYIYQGVDQYGSTNMKNRVLNMYNDIPLAIDEASYRELRDAGVDPALSQHIAHLFIRDP